MQIVSEQQLRLFGDLLVTPAFLLRAARLQPLNDAAGALRIKGKELLPFIPDAGDALACRQISLDGGDEKHCYTIAGRKISYCGAECWLLELFPIDPHGTLQSLYRASTAREIMLQISSQINQLDTDQDIYDFILDNCGKAVECSALCSLMIVDGDIAHIVAKRGFSDSVYEVSFLLNDTFIGLETAGKFDRIVTINDLDKFRNRYHDEIRTERTGEHLGSTLSAPIYVNGVLYAILCFDSIQKNAFTQQDEELLYIVKSNIEIILANHRMHMEILRLSQTDILTGLYNRTYLVEYLEKRLQKSFYVGMFDMNDLKGINDGHGHHSGDIALQRFAAVLKAAFPAGNAFFRMGGDEFLCILYGMELPAIQERIAALRSMLKHTPVSLADGTAAVLSFSCGFALHAPGAPVDDATQSADRTMYEEKRKFKANSL